MICFWRMCLQFMLMKHTWIKIIKFHLNDAGLLVYSHGEYLAGDRKVGTFGYSVKKKTSKRKK